MKLFSALSAIQQEKKLRSTWAESFFRQDSSEELTVGELNRRITAMSQELESLKKRRDDLQDEEAKNAAARAEAARNEKKAKLEALVKAKADLEAKENALRAELETPPNA